MSTPPRPSMVVSPGRAAPGGAGKTCVMRVPSTRTAPGKGARPVPSSTRTFVIRWPLMVGAILAPGHRARDGIPLAPESFSRGRERHADLHDELHALRIPGGLSH